jgi:hypothetical protein
MSLSRDSRQERKLKAFRRSQFRLKQAIERIDWEEDFLLPEIEALKAGRPVLGLPEGVAFDIQVETVEAEKTHEVQTDHETKTNTPAPVAEQSRPPKSPRTSRRRRAGDRQG